MIDYSKALIRIRAQKPLVHCIANIVTANDCANLLLAIGASPMMAQAEEEMADIAAISSAAVLNLGTPDENRFKLAALRCALANRHGHPAVLDPVGVGASRWRLTGVQRALKRFTPAIVRVNLSEAQALLGETTREHGVDSAAGGADAERADCAAALARQLRSIVLLSGEADFISDGARTERVEGGSAMTAMVTGSGCMLSALCGAFAAVEPDALRAAAFASAFWKDCAALAEQNAQGRGPGSFRVALIDAAYTISIRSMNS